MQDQGKITKEEYDKAVSQKLKVKSKGSSKSSKKKTQKVDIMSWYEEYVIDQVIADFQEQYNYDYYPKLIEACGYAKEIDWFEFALRAPKIKNEMLARASHFLYYCVS
jgi:hypothetical protein